MLGLVVTAALFGDAALRDIEVGMDPLLFTSPQRTLDHLGGRYLAALAVNALLLLAVPLGYALPTLIGYPDPAHFGDRKSTRLNSSHGYISYAVFCLKKKNTNI